MPAARATDVLEVDAVAPASAEQAGGVAELVKSKLYPATPDRASVAAPQATSIVVSFVGPPSWLALITAPGAPGAVVSIQNGPRCTVAPQLPAASMARTWSHQWSPSGELLPVKVEAACVAVQAGSVAAAWS